MVDLSTMTVPSADRGRHARDGGYFRRAGRSAVVLLVGYLFHPVHRLTVLHLCDGDVRHRAIGRGAVPVLLTGLEPDDVAGADLLDRPALVLHAAKSGGDEKRLAQRMRVPRSPRAWLEGDRRATQFTAAAEPCVNPDGAGEILLRPLSRGLRAAALDVHRFPPCSWSPRMLGPQQLSPI